MDTLSLKRIDGRFYVEMNGEMIGIDEVEAQRIMEDHSAVYDVIVYHRRKFHFNTAEDRQDNLYREL